MAMAESGVCLAERRKAVAKLYSIRLTCSYTAPKKVQKHRSEQNVAQLKTDLNFCLLTTRNNCIEVLAAAVGLINFSYTS